MSKSAGKQTGKTLVWILLLLLIVGLGGFGVKNFGGSIDSIGTVGDRKISIDSYGRALERELNARSAGQGERMSFADAEASGLISAIRARLIADTALDNELDRIGVSVGDERVVDEVMGVQSFQDASGNFNRETYRAILQQNGLTEAQFESRIRDEAARSLLQTAVVQGIRAPASFADTLYTFIAERRSAQMVELTADSLETPVPEPDQAQIDAQYEATPEAYTAPAIRKITYAWLTPDMMADKIEPDEEMLRQLYEERIDDFVQPERRLVERLVFPTEDDAEAAMARIAAGEETFEDAVAARGLALSDVDMGDVSEVDLGGDAGRAVFALTEPGLAGPAMSDLGPAIFRVNGILAAHDIPFEEARDSLVEEATRERAVRVIADEIGTFDDLLAAGATLEDLAAETDMELGQIDYSADSEEGIAAYSAFRDAADRLVDGDFPEIVELEDGGVFALRLDEDIPPALRPLEEVRDQVAADWQAAETSRRLNEMAQKLQARLGEGTAIDDLGLPVVRQEPMARGGLIPAALDEALFDLEAPGDSAVVADGGGVWLIQLGEILPPDESDPSAEFLRQTLSRQAAQGIAQDVYAGFAQALVDAAGLNLDQSALNAVHARFR